MNESLPALSLRQPWAWAILFAGKTVENRRWRTSYRGRLRIHAAKTYDSDGADWMRNQGIECPGLLACRNSGWLGAYLGEVTVLHCSTIEQYRRCRETLREEPSPWAFGPVCWQLRDPEAYPEPIPGRGFPGLYLPERFTLAPSR